GRTRTSPLRVSTSGRPMEQASMNRRTGSGSLFLGTCCTPWYVPRIGLAHCGDQHGMIVSALRLP
ncbi:MAG TPA: hypothetical protein PLJ27_20885, partial [Polyangiaceae bacterium]|nr:hypothetical protein [Polyangiaceae bacterium]